MKVYSAEQMKKLEKEAMKAGISPLVLMENAAIGICKTIMEGYAPDPAFTVAVICGRGNNGGDGMALARHLVNNGIRTKVLLAKGSKLLTPEAETNCRILKRTSIPIHEFSSPDKVFKETLGAASLIIDCLFGTGLTRDVEGFYRQAITFINNLKKPVVAVDIPSGINSDTGEVMGDAIKAQLTVALGAPKPGHLFFPGREYRGALEVSDISLPRSFYDSPTPYNWLQEDEVKGLLKKRRQNTHKGSYGHLAIIGGSPGKTGAPCMSGMAAMRSGAGLATVICSRSLNPVFESKLLEVMTFPVDDVDGFMSQLALDSIRDFLKDKDCVVLGPGLSASSVTEILFGSLFKSISIPAVVDADGLNLLAGKKKLLKNKKIILTPHPGEMARLSGNSISEVLKNPVQIASDFAREYGVHVVLKSSTTVLAAPGGSVHISTYGNAGMASAGSGDVLSGIIGSFISQGYAIEEAAQLGIVLHGLAGDEAKAAKGEHGLIASDIIEFMPHVLKNWEDCI
jgi:hydroxyethylthiazole kinase-like uncharacterized protein yjeF